MPAVCRRAFCRDSTGKGSIHRRVSHWLLIAVRVRRVITATEHYLTRRCTDEGRGREAEAEDKGPERGRFTTGNA